MSWRRASAADDRLTARRRPDIAIDDIHGCDLGTLNLIVDEKGFTAGYVPPDQR
jgi:hypothetical protein